MIQRISVTEALNQQYPGLVESLIRIGFPHPLCTIALHLFSARHIEKMHLETIIVWQCIFGCPLKILHSAAIGG